MPTRTLGKHSTKHGLTLEIIDSKNSSKRIRSASSKDDIVFVGQEVNVIGHVNVKKFNVNISESTKKRVKSGFIFNSIFR